MTDSRDTRLEESLRRHFLTAAEDLDPVTAARLAAARRRAVEAARRPARWHWLPAMATAAAGLMAVAILWRPAQAPTIPASEPEAVEILMHESQEMFEYDPDFFLWLDVAAVEG